MANRFWEFVGQFIPGTTVRAGPVNDKFEGIESAFEAIEGELDLSIRLPSTYTGTRSLPEVDPRECLLYINASNQLALYGMATFTASVNDVAIKHADVVARHADIITRHADVTTKHGDVATKHAAIMAMNFGTAAQANVTQSNMDTTAGRLLKVGDFGLGGAQAVLTDSDLSNASVGGFFLTAITPTNIPAGWDVNVRKQLININNGVNYAAQILIGMDLTDAGKMAIRTRSWDGSWSGWRELLASNNAALAALSALTPAADRIGYFDGASTAALATLTAFARTLLDDADAATARATLGAQASDGTLTALAGLATSSNKVPYFTGTDTAAMFDITSFSRGWLGNAYSDPSARYNMKAYGGDLGSLWTGSHVVADSPLTSSIALSSFPAYGVLHIQYLYGSQYGSFAVPYSQGGYAGQRFAIGAGYVSVTEITSALIRFQSVGISGSVTITQIWAQV